MSDSDLNDSYNFAQVFDLSPLSSSPPLSLDSLPGFHSSQELSTLSPWPLDRPPDLSSTQGQLLDDQVSEGSSPPRSESSENSEASDASSNEESDDSDPQSGSSDDFPSWKRRVDSTLKMICDRLRLPLNPDDAPPITSATLNVSPPMTSTTRPTTREIAFTGPLKFLNQTINSTDPSNMLRAATLGDKLLLFNLKYKALPVKMWDTYRTLNQHQNKYHCSESGILGTHLILTGPTPDLTHVPKEKATNKWQKAKKERVAIVNSSPPTYYQTFTLCLGNNSIDPTTLNKCIVFTFEGNPGEALFVFYYNPPSSGTNKRSPDDNPIGEPGAQYRRKGDQGYYHPACLAGSSDDQENIVNSLFGCCMSLVTRKYGDASTQILVLGYEPDAIRTYVVSNHNQASIICNRGGTRFPMADPPPGHFFKEILVAQSGWVLARVFKKSVPATLDRLWYVTPCPTSEEQHRGIMMCVSAEQARGHLTVGIVSNLNPRLKPTTVKAQEGDVWQYVRIEVDRTTPYPEKPPPCTRRNHFGEQVNQDPNYILRTDDAALRIRECIFRSTSSTPLLIVISGFHGAGKTAMVKALWLEAMDSYSHRFDQFGFFNAQRSGDNITQLISQHFLSVGEHLLAPMHALHSNVRQYRIFLVIDDCKNPDIVRRLTPLHPGSCILLTTSLTDLPPVGVNHFHLDRMTDLEGIELFRRRCGAFRCPIDLSFLRYVGGNPRLICQLADIVIKPGGVNDIKKLIQNRILGGLRADAIRQCAIDTIDPERMKFFFALAHFRECTPLPYSFILRCWSWMAHATKIPWTRHESVRLLTDLETRGLLSVSEHCSTHHQFCSVVYPKGFKVVTLRRVIWDECQRRMTSEFANLKELVFDHLGQKMRTRGTYDFFFQFAPTSRSNDLVLQFLLGEDQSQAEESPLNVALAASSEGNQLNTAAIAASSEENESSSTKRAHEIRGWIIRCLRTHFVKPKQKPRSMVDPTPSLQLRDEFSLDPAAPLPRCVCLEKARAGIEQVGWDDAFETELEGVVMDLCQCPNFFASNAVYILGSIAQSPRLAKTIFKSFNFPPDEHYSKPWQDIIHNPYGVDVLIEVMRLLPADHDIDPRIFNKMKNFLTGQQFKKLQKELYSPVFEQSVTTPLYFQPHRPSIFMHIIEQLAKRSNC